MGKTARIRPSDYKQINCRIESLQIVIYGLENSILELRKKLDNYAWYDGLWLLEESEPFYGLALIAFQNYINSSIYDWDNSLENQYKAYKICTKINDNGRTDIELICSLANYFKHRDNPKDLKEATSKILIDFNLQHDKQIDITDSPIFKGLEIFSQSWDLKEILKVIVIWREKLWSANDESTSGQKIGIEN